MKHIAYIILRDRLQPRDQRRTKLAIKNNQDTAIESKHRNLSQQLHRCLITGLVQEPKHKRLESRSVPEPNVGKNYAIETGNKLSSPQLAPNIWQERNA
jgi:hypothetical protein